MNCLLAIFGLFLPTLALQISSTELMGAALPYRATASFSPQGGIKNQLLQSIQETRISLDVAAFQLTSGDLAESLLLAKNRGVRVRLLLDQREAQSPNSLASFLREQGLEVKLIQGRLGGQMHYTFIIFDSNKVFTGSYSLTEYAENFNYENALFLEEPLVIAKYKTHFNKLFGEPLTELPTPVVTTPPEETRYFIGLSLSQIQQRLSKGSATEREAFWSHCKGVYVRGEGEVILLYPDLTKLILKDHDIVVEIAIAGTIPPLKEGQKVNYSGRLIKRPSTNEPYILDKGTIH